jgi:hypothetical protein
VLVAQLRVIFGLGSGIFMWQYVVFIVPFFGGEIGVVFRAWFWGLF